MKFVSLRSFTLPSTKGHVVRFEKGEPTFVPPALYAEAQAAGAVPEEELPEAPAKSGTEAPADPADREKAISEAMTQMVVDGRRDDFTAAGLPHLRVLKQVLGWEVPAPERDAVWAKLNQSSQA